MLKSCCLIVVVFLVLSCNDRPSWPVYTEFNEAIINGMDSVYLIGPEDRISIFPQVSFTLDTAVTNPERYEYEWIFLIRPSVGISFDYETIGTEKSLVDYDISQISYGSVGLLDFVYRVHDTYTDTFTEWPFRVVVGNEYYEGWVVLNEVQQGSRVDMLSYSVITDSFDYLKDVVDFSTHGAALGGAPIFIDKVMGHHPFLVAGGVIVGTDEELFACSSIDLKVVDAYYQSYDALKAIPPASKQRVAFYGGLYKQFLQINEAAYLCNEERMSQKEPFTPISVRRTSSGANEEFRAAVHAAVDIRQPYGITLLFDEDADEFVWHSTEQGYCSSLVVANNFDHASAWTLVYLEHSRFGGGQYTALLQEEKTGALYFTRFTIYDQLEFSKVDPQSDLYKASELALDPNTGDFYFSSGKEVFEYKNGTAGRIHTFEDEITMLKFNRFVLLIEFVTGATVNKDRYQKYEDKLLVATHNSAQPEDSGKLILFDLMKNKPSQQFDGFSKIIDVTYKER